MPGKTVHYEVQGEPQETDHSMTVEEILEKAGAPASIDVAEVGNYILEDLNTGKKYENLQDTVVIEEGDKFIANYRGKTPVA